MSLIDTLNLVKGAVSSKDLVPVLTHFAFKEGRVYAFDGGVSIDAPCEECSHLVCTVPADRFVSAVAACTDAPPAIVHDGDVLTVSTRKFSAKMPAGSIESFPFAEVEEEKKMRALPKLLDVLRMLRPFIGNDASRPWAMGVLFTGSIAAATNNVVIALCNTARVIKSEFILPLFVVDQLLRIGIDPLTFCVTRSTVIFHLPGDVQVRGRLVDDTWPKSPIALVDELAQGAAFKTVPKSLLESIEALVPFCSDTRTPIIEFADTLVKTVESEVQGTATGFKGLGQCRFRAEPLIEMLRVATHADFARFPRVPFHNADKSLRGAIVGMLS